MKHWFAEPRGLAGRPWPNSPYVAAGRGAAQLCRSAVPDQERPRTRKSPENQSREAVVELSPSRSSVPDAEDRLGFDAIDRSLMVRVVGRDQAAFAVLVERHARAALSLAQRIVRNSADAEDVVQESMARLWQFADRWNPEGARFSSWFYRIVTNLAISRVRRKTAEPIDAIEEPSDTSPGPHERMAGREIGQAIIDAISRLPARQRAAIALCYDQGLSCAEAAEVMTVSVGTMESLLFRARRSLREWLGPLNAEIGEG